MEGTYEYECMRAELLGIEKPDEVTFEQERERLQAAKEEQDAAESTLLDAQESALGSSGGKLDELNTILTSTQQKLNRFKQTACGSLSNIFNRGSNSVTKDASEELTSEASTSANAAQGEQPSSSDEIQPIIPTELIRKSQLEQKMTSHLGTLDVLINKAEQAEMSLSAQTKQMRKMAE